MPTVRTAKRRRTASADAFMRALMADVRRAGATEARIEPHAHGANVYLRIDGFLHDNARLAPETLESFIHRLKRLAELPDDEPLAAQEGMVRVPAKKGGPFKAHLRLVPVAFGEKAVLRMCYPVKERV